MKFEVSHKWEDESIESKMEWFLQKSPEERLLEAFQDTLFVQQLRMFELPDDRSSFKTYKIVERPRS